MKKEELVSRINALAKNSLGGKDSSLAQERARALEHYKGKPYGNEVQGRSQVVSRDIAETVDWIMPSLMRVFTQSGNLVEFLPVGPEDESLAQQETDYVNYVMMNENNGFLFMHDWVKDALILKNGYVKAYWEERTETTVESYSGLTMDEVTQLFEEIDGEVEVLSHDDHEITLPVNGVLQPVPVYDLKLRIKRKEGKECIEAIPAEEIRVSHRAKTELDDTDYIEHRTKKSRTDLIGMGMPKKFVNGLSAEAGDDISEEDTARDTTDDGSRYLDEAVDHSMDLIEYREVYCRVDFDDDGVAERRKVIIVGGEIPEGDEWNEEIDHTPIYFCTPKRMPHRHIGESIDDELQDLQLIKTILERALLDNTYGQVNQEWLVNERVNLDDFLVTRPLGVKRVADKLPIGDCAKPVDKPNILSHVLPVIQHIDQIKANRSGVNPPVTGVDPNVLKEVREKVASDNLDKANAKVEMIARMLAEIGLKPLARGVHADLIKHQDKEKIVKLRNTWISINPQEWRRRTDLRVTVGLGNGNREETKDTIGIISMEQEKAAQYGLVGPKQKFNSFAKLASALGEVNPEAYVMNPDSEEYKQIMQQRAQQPPPPNPLAEVEQIKQQSQKQIAQMKEQHKHQMDMMQMQAESQRKMSDQNLQYAIAQMKEDNKKNIAIMESEVKALIEGFTADIGKPGLGAEMNA